MSLASPHPSRLAPAPHPHAHASPLDTSQGAIDALLAAGAESAAAQQEAIAEQLGWVEFSALMDGFIRSIDAYTQQSKVGISQRGIDHAEAVREKTAERARVEKEIETERDNEARMLKTLETERAALLDLTHGVQSVSTNLSRLRDRSSALDTELARARRDASALRAEKERQLRELERQRALDGPELTRLEGVLGWKIEGVRADQIFMRFTQIDPADHDREFSLVLDTGGRDYAVPRCSPVLPIMPDLVAELNAKGDFYGFIRRVRQAFRASCSVPHGEDMFRDVAALSQPGAAAAATTPARTSAHATAPRTPE